MTETAWNDLTNEQRIDQIVGRHRAALVAYATRLTGGDRGRAEDVVQETFLRAWDNLDHLNPNRGSVNGWLCRVAHNLVMDGYRRLRARPPEQELAPEHTDLATQQDHAENVLLSAVVQDVLSRIWPEHRDALVEIYLHDRTSAQAAVVLGIPVGTVKSRVHYALRNFRQEAEHAGLRAS